MTRCAICPDSHRQVHPDGPNSARVMLIGEGPGRWEDSTGVPFCGRAGQELDQTYLRLAGLSRKDIFVTNCVMCRQERGGVDVKPSEALVKCCAEHHLRDELTEVSPEIVILAGATACSLVPGIDLEMEHGFPRKGKIFDWEGWIVPWYHPAAGMHLTRLMIPLLKDAEMLGKWLNAAWFPLSGQTQLAVYHLGRTEREVTSYFIPHSTRGCHKISIDTESNEGHQFSIQVSTYPGTGIMVLMEDKEAIKELVRCANICLQSQMELVFHNAPADLDVAESIGIDCSVFRDTMQELYHLGDQPQGLKAAVYRVFGHRMISYDETVVPHSKRALDQWLGTALDHVSTVMRTVEPHPAGPGCPTCGKKHRLDQSKSIPHPSEAVIRRVMSKIQEEGSEYDPWEPPKNQKGQEKPRLLGREWLPEVEAAIGRMPRKSIIHVPLDEAVQYGCSDADWTGRLATWLEGERERIVREEWKVA